MDKKSTTDGGERMSTTITKIKLLNYKRFRNYTIEPNSRINVLVGDNEAGKSSVLEAIDLVASGNERKVEAIGIDRLLNVSAVREYNEGVRTYENLPIMTIELYLNLNGKLDYTVNGKNNTDKVKCDGIRLVCAPNSDYQTEIIASMKEDNDYFPFDYYSIRFSTFADEGYTGYKKKLRSILIDSSSMGSDYATTDFIKRMYTQHTEDDAKERAVHKSKYRQMKDKFRSDSLQTLNTRIKSDKKYEFGLKPSSTTSLEGDLMIFEDNIGIDRKGTGRQVFIKTDFALERSGSNVDVVLIEEPENHLSHVNLRKLIESISSTQDGQLFIATHNSLISTRLELNNLLIMHGDCDDKPVSLNNLSGDTAKYFTKAPVAGILEYTISNKAILVEGPSEYMLFERFYATVANCKPEEDGVHIIDVRGLSFKRYLDIAKVLKNKVAVVTDNDGNKQTKCINKYADFADEPNVEIFFEEDDNKYTFEVVLYGDNQVLCDKLFNSDAQKYMLEKKTEAAYQLLSQDEEIAAPKYIKEAIDWIRK